MLMSQKLVLSTTINNKAYVDRIKYKIATCYIPNTLHISRCERFCKWKDNNM